MAPGTSPHGGIPFSAWTDTVAHLAATLPALFARALDFGMPWPWLARGAAALHLLALGLIMTMAWNDASASGPGATPISLPVLHLTFLLATGAGAALFAVRGPAERNTAARDEATGTDKGVNQLLAQMSHELRTPLNAVIGFSEVMLRELHGPLGHARYQEYAAHISESGGQLLKSSEDTLAVAATMSALMANRPAVRRQRVLAGALLREAWGTATAGAAGGDVGLSVTTCNTCEIECERRATGQALEHLLREAIARAPHGGLVQVKGRRNGGARSIEIRVRADARAADLAGEAPPQLQDGPHRQSDAHIAGRSLRVILARLLLEMQGATLSLWDDDTDAGLWSACVAFPLRGK